jgi:hypothetical protein
MKNIMSSSKRARLQRRYNKQQKPTHTVNRLQQSDVAQTSQPLGKFDWFVRWGVPGLTLGLLGLFVTALPHVEIGGRDSVDASLPFSFSFPVTNRGYFDVYNVFVSCHFNKAESQSGMKMNDVSMISSVWPMATLKAGDAFPVQCTDIKLPNVPFTSAEIDVGVMYRPKFFPKQFFTCAKFILDAQAPDHPHLLQYPGIGCEQLFKRILPNPLPDPVLFSPALWFW